MSRSCCHGERGTASIVELLVATAIFAVMLTATLAVYETFLTNDRATNERNDAQETARTTLDRMARDLRNLASPTESLPNAFDRAQAADMMFKTVDGNGPNAGQNVVNVQRVRYCLDTSNAASAKLYMQVQRWTTATTPEAPTGTTCPGSQWSVNSGTETRTQSVLAEHVTNYAGGLTRPVFTYDSVTSSDITKVHVDLRVDMFASSGPKETSLSTGVFLRNQNRRPTAAFTWSRNTGVIVLNASTSSDPEGQALDYTWTDMASPTTPIGYGVTLNYSVTAGSTHTIKLEVSDPAGLKDTTTQTGVTG
jgi:type II secretory pathway component PulJ